MDEYITKQQAIDACNDGYASCVQDCVDNIKSLPVVNAQEVIKENQEAIELLIELFEKDLQYYKEILKTKKENTLSCEIAKLLIDTYNYSINSIKFLLEPNSKEILQSLIDNVDKN